MTVKFPNENDHPFKEVADHAHRKILEGWTIYQKFTCQGCGHRQTINRPNQFFMQCECERCRHVTDIVETGCNFVAARSIDPPGSSGEAHGETVH